MVVEEGKEDDSKMSSTHSSGISKDKIENIMGTLTNTGSVKMNNHKKKLRQRFDIIKKLGQGTYGKVQLGINKDTGQEVAIKTIKKCKIEAEADLVRIRREVQIMSSVQHPNIIHIYEVFENREKMVLVMEFAAGGELYDYLSTRKILEEVEARRIFRQVATAVYYCHKHNICHRDLKLENILLDENGNAKIADFGLSNVFDGKILLNTFCGSPLYASPEIVKGLPYTGPEVDCWSLGVLLYTLVYGSMPFDGSNFKRLVKQISHGDFFEPKDASSASELIKAMLTVCPKERATIEEICCHWWVNESYEESCLKQAEELAQLTPVRLDVLLSLSPANITADQLVIPAANESINENNAHINRSCSVGSLCNMTNTEFDKKTTETIPTEEYKKQVSLPLDNTVPNKRKLDTTVSTESAYGDTIERKKIPLKSPHSSKSNITTEPLTLSKENESLPSAHKNISNTEIADIKLKNKSSHSFSPINNNHPEINHTKQILRKCSLPEDNLIKSNNGERRKSRILETAEKFNSMNNNTNRISPEKNKSISISGGNTGTLKRDFERQPSIPYGSENTFFKNTASRQNSIGSNNSMSNKNIALDEAKRSIENSIAFLNKAKTESFNENKFSAKEDDERQQKLRNAREIIGNAISLVPEKTLENTASQKSIKTSRAEIRLKSSTLPRRKPHKQDSTLENESTESPNYPHYIQTEMNRIIPDKITSPKIDYSQSIRSIGSSQNPKFTNEVNLLTRNNTIESSDSQESNNSCMSSTPIRKSPREFIIPIAIEGGGYITPKIDSNSSQSKIISNSAYASSGSASNIQSKPLRSIFAGKSLIDDHFYQHKNALRESSEIGSRPNFSLLRSSRSNKQRYEENDSQSSGEEDDDDGFEILSAEKLFSTLLQRVKDLTNRLNINDINYSGISNHSFLSNPRAIPKPRWNIDTIGRNSTSFRQGNESWIKNRDLESQLDSRFPKSNISATSLRKK